MSDFLLSARNGRKRRWLWQRYSWQRPFLIGDGNDHVVRLCLTYADAMSLNKDEMVMFRSSASCKRSSLRLTGTRNLTRDSFLLPFWVISCTHWVLYLSSNQKKSLLSTHKTRIRVNISRITSSLNVLKFLARPIQPGSV